MIWKVAQQGVVDGNWRTDSIAATLQYNSVEFSRGCVIRLTVQSRRSDQLTHPFQRNKARVIP